MTLALAILLAAHGLSPAGADAQRFTYSIETRGSVGSNVERFAAIADATLNDIRGWSLNYNVRYARVSSGQDFRLVLASPAAVGAASPGCSTRWSCRVGDLVLINDRNWSDATPAWTLSRRAYRSYVINHEVGHWLGLGHPACPRAGAAAPVMMQQSISLDGCEANVWPKTWERSRVARIHGIGGWPTPPRDAPCTIEGTDGDDRLVGTSGADVICGGPGSDRLVGKGGPDVLRGGRGDDVLNSGGGADLVLGGDGNDTIVGRGGDDRLEGNGGDDLIRGKSGADVLIGGDGNDRLLAGRGSDVVRGNRGRDRIVGWGGHDRLYGGRGADEIRGRGGNDTIVGAGGSDRLFGEAGHDRIRGQRGDDLLVGGSGRDELLAGRGDDRLLGGPSDDVLHGKAGRDVCRGGGGVDVFRSCEEQG